MDKEERIGYYIKMISNSMDNIKNKHLEEIDLTSSQAEILLYLCFNKDNDINQRELENKFKLSNPTINGILNRLESKKFIIRELSMKDARCKNIKITNSGFNLYAQMLKIANMMEKEITNGITSDEKILFINIIIKIYNNICNKDI